LKKLVIVSTKPDGGIGGGIPSALIGYMHGLDAKGVQYLVVESHKEGISILAPWLTAFWKISLIALKERRNVVFWFHCGPWLSLFRKFTLALIPRLLGSKTVAHIHSPTFNNYLSRNMVTKLLIKIGLMPFKEIVVLTPWWEKLLKKQGITKKITISANPNNEYYCRIAKEKSLNEIKQQRNSEIINIFTMARLIDGKGVELVIEAMLSLPVTFQLTIAGDGPRKQSLISKVNDLDLNSRVVFTGWIDGDKKEALLNQADIFCLPSSYDSFGMVFIEAMAFNLPVVAYDWGPIKDVVTEDVGLCCKEATAEEVGLAINKIYLQLATYQGKGPLKVLKQYTPETVTMNIIKLLS